MFVNPSWTSSSSKFTILSTADVKVLNRPLADVFCLLWGFFRHQQELTRDPVILNALLHVCKTMHDSVK